MPFLIVLFIVFVVVAIVAHRGKATRNCRWRANRSGDSGNLRKYHCIACGAEAFTATDGPPSDCRRAGRAAPL